MKPISQKLENLLAEKLDLIRRMEAILNEEIAQLSEKTLDDLSLRINLNDEAITAIKNIDYEISRIEAGEGSEASQMSAKAKLLIADIIDITRRNESKIVELIEKLNEMKGKAKEGLVNTVKGGQISGYKPSKDSRAYFVDKRK